MNSKLINRKNFYSNLFENNSSPDYIKSIHFLGHDITSLLNKEDSGSSLVYSLCFIPSYLKIDFSTKVVHSKVFQVDGFGIDLSNCNTADEYIKNQGSKNFRKVFFRCLNRLEKSFNISYKMYYGSIEKETYDVVMKALENMISKRFQNRGSRNKVIDNWQQHYNQTINLINQKQASLFVIYDNHIPIEVSINYHKNAIMYSAISSFDLDYSKFSLGNIEIYKQLEWCLLNDIKFFDMGYGDFEYKRRWSNQIYSFSNYVISKKQKAVVLIFATILKCKYKIVNFLLKIEIKKYAYNLINAFKKDKKEDLPDYQFELNPIEEIPNFSKEIISINAENNQFIRQPLYNYLYSNNVHINNVNVYEIASTPRSYVIEDDNKLTELTYKAVQNV